jgi:hypothetical protein
MTDRGFKAMLDLIKDMLSQGNKILMTTYEAKQNVYPLGLDVERIHACKNDCVLFRGDDYEDFTECPECGFPRYKRRFDGGDDKRKHGASYKVAWNFPIHQRLRHLFSMRKDAELLRWHDKEHKKDDFIRHPADGTQWPIIDHKYEEMQDPRHLRFALSTEGMNPFGHMSNSPSFWPVLLSIYNLPPWLCNKRKYMMMLVLISGRQQHGININVYLRPLIDDMKKLWSPGIQVYDAIKNKPFTLHGMILTTISDIPGGRSVSGQCKGEKDYMHHLDDTETIWLNHSKNRLHVRH